MHEWVGLVAAAIIMFIGLLGSVLPGIPGAPLIFIAAVAHKIIYKNESAGYFALALILIFMVLSLVLDFLASILGAKKLGATWRGMLGAMVGAIVGLFFNLPGLILGPIIGAIAFEMAAGREWKESTKAGAGAMIGFFLGALGKVICCVIMIAIFFFSTLWNAPSSSITSPSSTISHQTPLKPQMVLQKSFHIKILSGCA